MGSDGARVRPDVYVAGLYARVDPNGVSDWRQLVKHHRPNDVLLRPHRRLLRTLRQDGRHRNRSGNHAALHCSLHALLVNSAYLLDVTWLARWTWRGSLFVESERLFLDPLNNYDESERDNSKRTAPTRSSFV